VDCQSVLESLSSSKPVVGLVKEGFDSLQNLSVGRSIQLHWIPAHCGFEGNESADVLAKRACKDPFIGPLPSIPVSHSLIKHAIGEHIGHMHNREWHGNPSCRLTKQFIRNPYGNTEWKVLYLSRQALRLLTQVITGHNTLHKHLKTMGLAPDSTCTFCNLEDETSNHFFGVCEVFAALRHHNLGGHTLTPQEISNIPPTNLAKFIVRSGRFSRNQGMDGPEQQSRVT